MSHKRTLSELNQPMTHDHLDREELTPNPWTIFSDWLDAAIEAQFYQPNAMMLATCGDNARPSVRTLLLKAFDEEGLYFYTNYLSSKGQDLAQNPQAEMLFYWDRLERQVRIYGEVTKLTHQASEVYFHTRPRDSQIGALASPQSQVIENRKTLETRYQELAQQFGDAPIPLPETWGGYCLKPQQFEFWQGRESRLHDRFRYRHQDNTWLIERLAP